MAVATNFNEFVSTIESAERTMLNSEMGQQLTSELLEMKLEANPNMTAGEWQRTKSEFMTFLFVEMMKHDPALMKELGGHVYNELRES